MRILLACCFSLALAAPMRADDRGYARPELLVEPSELAKRTAETRSLVLDARSRKQYDAGHIRGAAWVDHEQWFSKFGQGQDARNWSQRIGGLGIDADTRVIVYDDNFTKDAARIWWILRYWGVKDVRLLNGGWRGYLATSGTVEATPAQPTAVRFAAQATPARLATKEHLLSSLEKGTIQIVDARSEKEHCGVDKLKNKRAGAIPGAKQLEWIDLVDKESNRFKNAAELKKLFTAAGIDLSQPTATHCQSGGRSSVMAFGLELMGARAVSNYYPSWAEWSNAADTPVVPGQPRKK